MAELQRSRNGHAGGSGGAGGSATGAASGRAGGSGAGASGAKANPAGMGPTPGLRQRQAGPATQEEQSEDHKATPEQRKLVADIRKTKDYYDVLGVSRGSATDDDIKRAYRKLALKLHPDKNKARGADEAFKLVSKAFSCLSDPEKRRHYDQYGAEEPAGSRFPGGGGGGGGYPGGMYAGDIDPDEIFRMFFGGNPFMNPHVRMYRAGQGRRHAGQQQGQQQQQPASPLIQLMQFAPLILLLLFSFLSRPSQPVYSLSKSRDFPHHFATATYEVPYYVADAQAFHKNYPPGSRERVRLEHGVEQEYREMLQHHCRAERMQQQRYQYYGYTAKAQAMELRHCQELTERFGGRHPRAGLAH
ncbi:hypothetical protein N2152v2_005177 [Parachlorella kessleri]